MEELITLLGKEDVVKAISAITILGGVAVTIFKFILRVITTQNMTEIEKVFMNRSQRTKIKFVNMVVIVMILWGLNVFFVLQEDPLMKSVLVLVFVCGLLMSVAWALYIIICSVLRMSNEKWKDWMMNVLFISEYMIGITFRKVIHLVPAQSLWMEILMCFIAALIVSAFMALTINFFEDRPSKVYFYQKRRGYTCRTYIYFKLEDNILLCGDNRDIRQAKIILMDLEYIKKQKYK